MPWLKATEAVSPHVLGAFAGALTLSRIPTQFVSAVDEPAPGAPVRGRRSAGDEAAFRRVLARTEVLTAALGVAYVVAFAVLGQLALRLMLGPDFSLDVANLAVLAGSEQRHVRRRGPAGRARGDSAVGTTSPGRGSRPR